MSKIGRRGEAKQNVTYTVKRKVNIIAWIMIYVCQTEQDANDVETEFITQK